jgi:serine/threonine-protein kinase
MNFLHLSGVIHHDLSLGNLLLTSDWTLKVADFGCSKIATTASIESGIFGTPEYHSFEAAAGSLPKLWRNFC